VIGGGEGGGGGTGSGRCQEESNSNDVCQPEPSSDPAPKECLDAESSGNRADFAQVMAHEEPRKEPYLVDERNPGKFPNSGVTVGTGVDLRWYLPSELRSWGVSQATVTRLTPAMATAPGAFGPAGVDTVEVLKKIGDDPLPPGDLDALNAGAFKNTFRLVGGKFSSDQTVGVPFDQLPEEIQTVVVDAAYPFGTNRLVNGGAQATQVWSQLTKGDYLGAANSLAAWSGGAYAQRMHDLAALLKQAIKDGKIPEKAKAGRC